MLLIIKATLSFTLWYHDFKYVITILVDVQKLQLSGSHSIFINKPNIH
jgi:hypothetical protein